MEIFLIITLSLITVVLFVINTKLTSLDKEINNIRCDIIHDVNPNLITIGNHVVSIVDSVDGIKEEIRLTEEEKKEKKKQEKKIIDEFINGNTKDIF